MGIIKEKTKEHTIERLVEKYANSQTLDILIRGETGTGKSLLAQKIHRLSNRTGKFVHIHTPLLKTDLWQSQLFGHEEGSFTGAMKRQLGMLDRANKGTLFFDEIADIPLELQTGLLDTIETKSYTRLGCHKRRSSKVKLIFASNQNLEDLLHTKVIRHDFYHRIKVGEINLPALRDIPEKLPSLCKTFLEKYAKLEKRPVPKLNEETLEKLHTYPWPGNIRELEHVIQRAMVIAEGEKIQPEDILF